MRHRIVKMCSKCHTVKPLVKHRTLCQECNLVRKRAVAANKLATPEGREANRTKAAAFRATEEGAAYAREYAQNLTEDQIDRRNELARGRYEPNPRKVMTPEEKRAHTKTYRAKNRRDNYAVHLHRELRARAQRNQLPFNLTLDYIEDAMERGACEISGLPFQESGRRGPFSMSIDKIKPELGYVTGNTRAVLWCVNAAMGDWGLEVMLPIFRAIVDAAPKTGV